MLQLTEKYCVDCRFHRYPSGAVLSHVCMYRSAKSPRDIVTGDPLVRPESCHDMRANDCGRDGKFFMMRIDTAHPKSAL